MVGMAGRTHGHFYPRPPRGGRHFLCHVVLSLSANFYPRPPRGGRQDGAFQGFDDFIFLSTPSARRATMWSISPLSLSPDFYPRPPRGGRPSAQFASGWSASFLSTPSARRATLYSPEQPQNDHYFYPRPPRGGRRFCPGIIANSIKYFYPRPPRGGRPVFFLVFLCAFHFYPRPPRGGRPRVVARPATAAVFLSTPSARRATWITFTGH